MLTRKNEQLQKSAIYGIFAILIFLIHIPWTYLGDDLFYLPNVSQYTLWDHFKMLYHHNGKIFTDLLANAFYRIPFVVWKIIDTGIYVGIGLLICYIFTKNTPLDALIVCSLLLSFPFFYISTAGYICTSTNYIVTSFCMLMVLLPIKRKALKEHVPFWLHIIVILCMLYASNQDQSGVCLIGGLFLYAAYLHITKADKQLKWLVTVYFILMLCCFCVIFFIPGHINRLTGTAEMDTLLPQYANWSLATKIYHGYTSTVSHIMFDNISAFVCFCVLLFLHTLLQERKPDKWIAAIPLVILLIVNIVGKTNFIYYTNGCVTEIYPLTPGVKGIITLLLSIIILFCIFFTVLRSVKNTEEKWLIVLLLILGAGSREMMGLSSTIYASSYRTFTYFIFALLICCITLLNSLRRSSRKDLFYIGIGLVSAGILLQSQTPFWYI